MIIYFFCSTKINHLTIRVSFETSFRNQTHFVSLVQVLYFEYKWVKQWKWANDLVFTKSLMTSSHIADSTRHSFNSNQCKVNKDDEWAVGLHVAAVVSVAIAWLSILCRVRRHAASAPTTAHWYATDNIITTKTTISEQEL